MDKFERMMQQMAKMTEEERMQMIESKKDLCICGDCPAYNDCARENRELLYCALGNSPKCIAEETSCICLGCPITDQMGLTHEFFCTRGSEREQREI